MELSLIEIKKLCADGKIKWTAHILSRLQERGIEPSDIRQCIKTGEMIEEYPIDYPYPSCLVLGLSLSGKCLHVVIGVGNEHLWLITAYYPDNKRWDDTYKVRKVGI